MPIIQQIRRAWNAFRNNDDSPAPDYSSSTYSARGTTQYRLRYPIYNERSIVSSIYTRIAVDVAGVLIKHVKVDKDGRYLKDMHSV